MSFTSTISRVGVENGIVDHFLDALAITLSEEFKGARGALGCLQEALPLRIFPDRLENSMESRAHGFKADAVEPIDLAG